MVDKTDVVIFYRLPLGRGWGGVLSRGWGINMAYV